MDGGEHLDMKRCQTTMRFLSKSVNFILGCFYYVGLFVFYLVTWLLAAVVVALLIVLIAWLVIV